MEVTNQEGKHAGTLLVKDTKDISLLKTLPDGKALHAVVKKKIDTGYLLEITDRAVYDTQFPQRLHRYSWERIPVEPAALPLEGALAAFHVYANPYSYCDQSDAFAQLDEFRAVYPHVSVARLKEWPLTSEFSEYALGGSLLDEIEPGSLFEVRLGTVNVPVSDSSKGAMQTGIEMKNFPFTKPALLFYHNGVRVAYTYPTLHDHGAQSAPFSLSALVALLFWSKAKNTSPKAWLNGFTRDAQGDLLCDFTVAFFPCGEQLVGMLDYSGAKYYGNGDVDTDKIPVSELLDRLASIQSVELKEADEWETLRWAWGDSSPEDKWNVELDGEVYNIPICVVQSKEKSSYECREGNIATPLSLMLREDIFIALQDEWRETLKQDAARSLLGKVH
jgi:hypothetical protein